ncbi:hypothetical protein ACTXT7_014872, partial [Hymenolepis weldensis]
MPEISLSSQMTELNPEEIHSTITRCPDNSFVLSATAQNKIFVNNKRISGDVQLKEKDVISFGWPYSKPVRRGEVVDSFKYDLKYKVRCVYLIENSNVVSKAGISSSYYVCTDAT